MKKIVIISFYELKDYFLYIKEIFEQYHFVVLNYPLFRYAYDSNDKIDNYDEHLDDYIRETDPDIILWWFIDVPCSVFTHIKKNHKDKYFIMYNIDDPINLTKELFDKSKIFDLIITPCKESIYLYNLYSGVNNVIFGPMGCDTNLFKPLIDSIDGSDGFVSLDIENKCDISIVCYNLFSDENLYPNQVIPKLSLISNIINLCERKNYTLKLFGTPMMKELYSKYYCGEIPYYKMNLLYNYSKINIVSSPDKNKTLYVNEYVIPILGSGGLLMHDKTKHIDDLLRDNENCLIYDSENYLNIIENVLENYNYEHIKKKAVETAQSYTWDIWVKNIVREIGKKYFDGEQYAKFYNIDSATLDDWLDRGIEEKRICYSMPIPPNFDAMTYISDTNIKSDSEYAYFHWVVSSKNPKYLKKCRQKGLGIASYSPGNDCIVMDDYYNICSILNRLIKYNSRDCALDQLGEYCKTVPYIKINNIINMYIENIY